MFDTGGGTGFSAIAEAYLNFGILGVVFYFFGLGYLLGKIDHINLRSNSNALIFTGAMMWPLIKTVRNSFGVFMKPLGLVIAILLIWRLLTFWRSHR